MQDLNVEIRQTPGEIACNFDDLKAALENQMQAYQELEITEDVIKERKKDVATLRKIRKAVDDKRKEVEREFKKPLDEFKKRVDDLTGTIDTQINRINEGLAVFEEKRRAEKREHIKALYDAEIGDLAEYLPLDVIRSSKWENVTFSDNEIISEIQEYKMKVKSDLAAIQGLRSEIEADVIKAYKNSGNNLTYAIQKHTDYMDAKAKAEARVKAEQEKQAEAKPEPMPEPIPAPIPEPVKQTSEPVVAFRIRGEIHISEVREYLDFNGIPYEEV